VESKKEESEESEIDPNEDIVSADECAGLEPYSPEITIEETITLSSD